MMNVSSSLIYSSCNLFNFGMTSAKHFQDLKRYRYWFWFGFPAFLSHSEKLDKPVQNVADVWSEEQVFNLYFLHYKLITFRYFLFFWNAVLLHFGLSESDPILLFIDTDLNL